MLPKNQRLNKKEFDRVYSEGSNIRSNVGYFKVVEWKKETKIACVASKKSAKNSVDRTRIRRRGYAAFEEFIPFLSDGYGIIWFLPQDALMIDFLDLKKAAKIMINSLNGV